MSPSQLRAAVKPKSLDIDLFSVPLKLPFFYLFVVVLPLKYKLLVLHHYSCLSSPSVLLQEFAREENFVRMYVSILGNYNN